MIIASYIKREPGKIYTSNECRDINGVIGTLTFLVKRITTKKEYLDFCKEMNAPFPMLEDVPYYYEILTD